MTISGPRRTPAAGGYACGASKRSRIVEAAIRVFGERGFAEASTRDIAGAALVSNPALQYYFTGKEGLHLACAEHIASRALDALTPALDAAAGADRATAPAAACRLLDDLAAFMFVTCEAEGWARFLARGHGEGSGPGHAVIKARLILVLHSALARLAALAAGAEPGCEAATVRAISILGQLTVFRHGAANALASLGWTDIGGERLAAVRRAIREQTMAILALPIG